MASLFVLLISAAALLILSLGCATGDPAVSPSSNASRHEVMGAALELESQGEGRSVSIGTGPSMAPVYGGSSFIVTHPVAFGDLAAGMIVAFISEEGGRVVHQLTRETPLGWKSRGINNRTEDPGYVTPENLLGVVYGVFQAGDD